MTSKVRLISFATMAIFMMAGSAYGERKPRLGVAGRFLSGSAAVEVIGIQESSPAAAVGLQEGDLISTLDGQPAATVWMRDKQAGVPITLEVEREGRRFKIEVTPAVPFGSWLQGLVQEYARARYWLRRQTSQHTVGTWSGSGSGTITPGQYATTTQTGVSGIGSSTTSELESWTLYRGSASVYGLDFMGLFRDAGLDPLTILGEEEWTAVVRQHCLAQGPDVCSCAKQGNGGGGLMLAGVLIGVAGNAPFLIDEINGKNEGNTEFSWKIGLGIAASVTAIVMMIAGGVMSEQVNLDEACVAQRSRDPSVRLAGYQFLAASGQNVGLDLNNAAHRARVEELAARANRRLRDSYGLDLTDVAAVEEPQK